MRIRSMNPEAHDHHIAYVSHLSHISSFMLGKTVIEKEKNERDIFDMAGSGFESTVRLAKSSPAMWTPIFKQNKENGVGKEKDDSPFRLNFHMFFDLFVEIVLFYFILAVDAALTARIFLRASFRRKEKDAPAV